MIKFIIAFVVIPLVAVLLAYFLNRNKPNIQYTLSDGILVSFLQEENVATGSRENSVQEIVVNNYLGKGKAEKIQLKIQNKNILKHDIIKHSMSDTPDISTKDNYFELLYPELPPQGKFSLIIKTESPGITYDDLTVYDSTGLCKRAFSRESISIKSIVLNIAMIFYLILITFQFISLRADDYRSKIRFLEGGEIFEKTRPFYMKVETWNKIIKEILEEKIIKDHYANDVEKSISYKILSLPKPHSFSPGVWESLKDEAEKEIGYLFSYRINNLYSDSQIMDYLKIKKPSGYSENKWKHLQDRLTEIYLKNKQQSFYNISTLTEEIKSSRPDAINQDTWIKYQKYLKKEYVKEIAQELEYKKDPLEFLKQQNISDILEEEDIEKLKKRAYRIKIQEMASIFNYDSAKAFLELAKPGWIEEKDYEYLRNYAQDTIRAEKFSELYDLINRIVSNQLLPIEKPEILSQDEWDSVKGIQERVKK